MFWNVTFIYNAFICTTDHCKAQTAFASRVVKITRVVYYPGTRWVPGYPRQPCTRAFNEFLQIFLISENWLKFSNFFCWGNEFSIYGCNQFDVWAESSIIWMLFWTATSMSSTKLCDSGPSRIRSCGLFGPMLGKNDSVNQIKAMPCLVQPLSDQLQVVPVGAANVLDEFRDLRVFPFTITCGGIAAPAGFTAAIIVMVSRFPLVWLWRYFEPFCATIKPGLWSSCSPVSSIFHMDAGLLSRSASSIRFFRHVKYLSTFSWSMHSCWTAAVPSGCHSVNLNQLVGWPSYYAESSSDMWKCFIWYIGVKECMENRRHVLQKLLNVIVFVNCNCTRSIVLPFKFFVGHCTLPNSFSEHSLPRLIFVLCIDAKHHVWRVFAKSKLCCFLKINLLTCQKNHGSCRHCRHTRGVVFRDFLQQALFIKISVSQNQCWTSNSQI